MPSPEYDDQFLEAATYISPVEGYLRLGNSTPSLDVIQRLTEALEAVESTSVTYATATASAHLDVVRHPDAPEALRAASLVKAAKYLVPLKEINESTVPHFEISEFFRGQIQLAFLPHYAKIVRGQNPDVNDMARLHEELLAVALKTIPFATIRPYTSEERRVMESARGTQFEIGAHLLNTRFNLRHGEIMQYSRPALVRETNPHDFRFEARTAWKIAFSTEGFLDETSVRRVLLNGRWAPGRHACDESVIVIYGKEDLRMATTLDIVSNIGIEEGRRKASPAAVATATKRLDRYEQLFNQKLGWTY